jgi:hypothetical protein
VPPAMPMTPLTSTGSGVGLPIGGFEGYGIHLARDAQLDHALRISVKDPAGNWVEVPEFSPSSERNLFKNVRSQDQLLVFSPCTNPTSLSRFISMSL